jgi:negative modulator of initiation of replication
VVTFSGAVNSDAGIENVSGLQARRRLVSKRIDRCSQDLPYVFEKLECGDFILTVIEDLVHRLNVPELTFETNHSAEAASHRTIVTMATVWLDGTVRTVITVAMNPTRNIDVEADVYAHIVANTSEIGENASSILRRLLKLPATVTGARSTAPVTEMTKSELAKLLESSEFIYAKGVVGRFLVLLQWLHKQNPEGFAKVEAIKGRGRIYFAKKTEILEAAGRSVNPKQISGTPYWVITTTPTLLKQDIVHQVMQMLGYGRPDIEAAKRALA